MRTTRTEEGKEEVEAGCGRTLRPVVERGRAERAGLRVRGFGLPGRGGERKDAEAVDDVEDAFEWECFMEEAVWFCCWLELRDCEARRRLRLRTDETEDEVDLRLPRCAS